MPEIQKNMNIVNTGIDGVVIIEPKVFGDNRGYFFESFSQRDFDSLVRRVRFVQDNESKSCGGVLRGLHFQKPPFAQSKLVRVVRGAREFDTLKSKIFDRVRSELFFLSNLFYIFVVYISKYRKYETFN